MPPVQCVGELLKLSVSPPERRPSEAARVFSKCDANRESEPLDTLLENIQASRGNLLLDVQGGQQEQRRVLGRNQQAFSTAAFLNPGGVVFVADIDSDREATHPNRWRPLEVAPR
jgi:hypothetical protein